MRSNAAALCVLLAAGCGDGPTPRARRTAPIAPPEKAPASECLANLPGDRFATVGRALCAEVEHHRVPGAAVAIALDGSLAWTFATGRRCLGQEGPVTPDTRFRIGSITKLLTAAVAVDLAGTGTVDLDAPVTAHLPELQLTGGDVPTLRDLLLHRSGLRDIAATPGQATATVETLGPWSLEGRGTFRYANAGYSIVGAALERAAGTDFATLLETRLAAPLGLTSIRLAAGEPVEAAACGHTLTDKVMPLDLDFERLAHGARWTAPSGAAVASAADLVRLALATGPRGRLAHLSVLWERTIATPDGDDYGMGVRVRLLDDAATLIHHAGDTGTFFADLYWVPEDGFAVAVLANRPRPLRATLTAALSLYDPGLSP